MNSPVNTTAAAQVQSTPEGSATLPGSPDGALLVVDGLVKHFPVNRGVIFRRQVGAVQAVDGLSFSVAAGETLGLVGESGCGKTTTGRLLTRLLAPTAGSIRFDGREIAKLSMAKMRPLRRDIQMIFQDPYSSLNPRHTVGTIVGAPLKLQKVQTELGIKKTVQDLLALVGLNPEHYNRYPHEFSGGQRQRIGIARTLALKPKLIVADEPVSMVDASLRALILENMLRLKNEFGISFLYITHDLSTAFQVSDDIFILYLGRVAEHGDVTKLIPDPQHPYTQLLVGSVPKADPDAYWEGRVELPLEDEIRRQSREQCLFAPRCPFVLPRCRQSRPPSYVVGPNHYAACFLHEDKPVEVGRESLHPTTGV